MGVIASEVMQSRFLDTMRLPLPFKKALQ